MSFGKAIQYTGEMKNKGYEKFCGGAGGGGNKVNYGRCASGEFLKVCFAPGKKRKPLHFE